MDVPGCQVLPGKTFGRQQLMKILYAEDDVEAAAYVCKGLSGEGHVVDHLPDGRSALAQAMSGDYDLLILDRMMPGLDGLSVLKALRTAKVATPAIILTAMGSVDDRVAGLRGGADDYMVKPFALQELEARLQVLVRRANPGETQTRMRVGGLEMDLLARKVTRDGQDIDLQPREFRLLEYLMKHAGQVVTRTMLLENVWDYHFDPQTNVIDVHISRLRAKIDKNFETPLLHTVRGAGYTLRAPG